MALAVNRTQIKELVAQRIPLFLLRQNARQRNGKLAQPGRLRPGAGFALIAQERNVRKQPLASTGALVEASHQLFAEGLLQHLQLAGFYLIARIHKSLNPIVEAAQEVCNQPHGRGGGCQVTRPLGAGSKPGQCAPRHFLVICERTIERLGKSDFRCDYR
jgi:hypothetical protein